MPTKSDNRDNPYADDQDAQKAIALLVRFMKEKVNPDFSEDDAWDWYVENKPFIAAEME